MDAAPHADPQKPGQSPDHSHRSNARPHPSPPAPLLPPAIGLMLGIAADAWFGIPAWCAAILLAVAVLLAWRIPRRGVVIAIALAAAALGAVRHDADFDQIPAAHLAHLANGDSAPLVRVAGRIASRVRIESDDESARRGPFPTEPRTRFLFEADSIHGRDGPVPATGRVLVNVAAPALQLAEGQRVEVFGRLYTLRGPDNPGQFDWSLKRRRDGIRVGLSCGNERCVRVLDASSRGAAMRLRQWLRTLLIDETSAVDEAEASLLDAMVLAQRGSVERSLDEAFIRTGTVHFLSASGMNVMWLAGFIWMLGWATGTHYRANAARCIAAILVYGIVAEPNPPILRAVVTGSLFFAAQWLRRPASTLNGLAAAVFLLLLARPTDLFDAGFQFSFAIVAAMVMLTPALMHRLTAPATIALAGADVPLDAEATAPISRGQRFLRAMLLPLLTTLIAWLVAIPIAAYHFERFCPWGWANSLVMVPLAFLVMFAGVTKLIAAALFPSLGALLAGPLAILVGGFATLARQLADVPGVNLDVPRPTLLWIIAWYAVLVVLTRGLGRRPLRILAWLAVVPLVIGLFMPWRGSPRRADELRVWCLAVGDGSATVIELPNGRTLAYDFGTRGFFDPAANIILPFLRERGINHIDTVVVSHTDFDHYGAIPDIARAVQVDRVLVNSHFNRFAPPGSAPRRFLDALQLQNIRIESLNAGDALPDTGDVRIEFLWPPADADAAVQLVKDNDASTVLRIAWRGRSLLLTGDITDAAQALLIRRGGLHADVLSLPHHGSTTARTLNRFVEAVSPAQLLRSTGQRDRDTSDRLWPVVGERPYYSTAECGATCVVIDAANVRIETFRPARGKPRR